ncbi:NUDIX hydrolase [Luteibacter rhizovicinus DSM 16549]|uniref:NUDIX hydrolase n=1 Tax=Luteibacter rhizovicinus DSM 16549 TaxID=1440763 RepID=A0A0G9H4U4_9GAMM|nr:NUDIX hydrolase [Luteibacter rhizovicinus]APG05750.1 NUDIX hydrolase [Luteibacter rhizovicinus DSM 16549]KLD64598.1 NUDIX hydrolase [Luteibacter rhizovicinus DSM 16549]
MDHPYPALSGALARYSLRFPAEPDLTRFDDWLCHQPQPFHRETRAGHFTGSAWLVSADGERVLLMHHRKLQRWLQLGGHADGDADLAKVALREAEEESGLTDLHVLPEIFDVDLHVIPARRDEPEHDHYDVRYVVVARGSEVFTVNEESLDLAWRPIADLAADPAADLSLRRMAAKWLAR